MRLVSYLFCRSRMFEVQCPLEFFFSTPSNFQFKSVEVVFRVKKNENNNARGENAVRVKFKRKNQVPLQSIRFTRKPRIQSKHVHRIWSCLLG